MSFILGLTGGIGSGKSAASQWFEQQNIAVIDADVVAREIVQPNAPVLAQIQQHFGDWVLLPNGELNRTALRQHIFANPLARQQLEQITHPAIRARIIEQLQQAQTDYRILVSPLLFETKQHQLTDRSLLIDATPELQIQRASLRDGQDPQQIEKIIAAQMSRQQKQQMAHDIVVNDGELEHLHQKLAHLHQYYLQLAEKIKKPF